MAKKKKSAAQIRRMQERAAKRGEAYEYNPPSDDDEEEEEAVEEKENEKDKGKDDDNDEGQEQEQIQNDDDEETIERKKKLTEAAIQLQKSLKEIEDDTELKSKDRRSAKRKAEAIASEISDMTPEELLKWLEQNPVPPTPESNKNDNNNKKKKKKKATQSKEEEEEEDPETQRKIKVGKKLKNSLQEIENSTELKAKDRRSAKRKAEAIALEEMDGITGITNVEELLEWYDKYITENNKQQQQKKKKKKHDPYIAFIGQMSFDTTAEQLLEHIRSNLINDIPKIKKYEIKIRILTDKKTKKSRGMAFVEVDEPDTLYALLKLHQTFLNGRRINVERSAGGSKNSETRKTKIATYRKEQTEYFEQVVDQILDEYKKTGELRDDELDQGVITLCRHHSGPVVRAAVAKYIEGSGRDMDNPSAYLTFLITKFAKEGVYDDDEQQKRFDSKSKQKTQNYSRPPPVKRKWPSSSNDNSNNNNSSSFFDANKRLKQSSKFVQKGIDMSQSKASNDVTKIFPSARRGRGYMM